MSNEEESAAPNPFQILRDVEMGRIDVGEAAKALDLTPRAVMARLAAWSGHLAYLAWVYPALTQKNPPDRDARSELIGQVCTRINRSRRQVTRMIVEYAALASPQTFVERKLGTERKKEHLIRMESIAAKVLLGHGTVSDLLNTSETYGHSRSAVYRAAAKLTKRFDTSLREFAELSPDEQAKLAVKVEKYIKGRENELVRDQIARDKATRKRLAARRRISRVGAHGDRELRSR